MLTVVDTLTSQVAVLLPSSVATVILQEPTFKPVTIPSASTVATVSSLLLQETDYIVALLGDTVAFKTNYSPTAMLLEVTFSFTPVTRTSGTTGVSGVDSFIVAMIAKEPSTLSICTELLVYDFSPICKFSSS